MATTLLFHKIDEKAIVPTRQYKLDSGIDVASYQPIYLEPGETYGVKTGLRVAIISDQDVEVQVRSRSGLALRGLFVMNSPGTIDQGYTGEIIVILHNSSDAPISLPAESRIAQLVVCPVIRSNVSLVDKEKFEQIVTDRGANGFGSTGV